LYLSFSSLVSNYESQTQTPPAEVTLLFLSAFWIGRS
jgi:hypothetical protein